MLTLLPVVPTVTVIAVPHAESPAQHVRNALMLLHLLEQMSPALWQYTPELSRAYRRAEAALVILEHGGPPACAALHLQRAIEALLAAELDWEVVEIIPGAMARLFHAWFPVTAAAQQN
jgi:hypothetical protein